MTRPSLLNIIAAAHNDYGQIMTRAGGAAPSLTVIVAWYRGELFLPHLAAGLNGQSDQDFELVLVDDDPTHPFAEESLAAFTKQPTVLRHDRNHGSPCAKNTGLRFAETDAVLFLDQDMVLPPHAVRDLRAKLAHAENLVAVGFRGTAVPQEGHLATARLDDDWRVAVTPDETYLPATNSLPANGTKPALRTYHLLEESDEFRAFGHGRVIGLWDLPVMVVGHTLAAHTRLLRAAGGFPEGLIGWGTDDTALGAFLIAQGALIVPASEVVSTQVSHRPWSGSREIQLAELAVNLERYRQLLESSERLDKTAERRFRKVGSAYRVEFVDE